jgi:hypothetical protein
MPPVRGVLVPLRCAPVIALGFDVAMARRFWAKVSGGDFTTCWEWTAFIDRNGYGRFSVGGRSGRMENAHRVAWMLIFGEIPAGLHVDHLCRNRSCVNPWHLDVVTVRVNVRRGAAGEVNAARQRAITVCPSGHAYDAENTSVRRSTGARRCKACERTWAARRKARSAA